MKNRLKILNLWVDPVNMVESLFYVIHTVEKGHKPHSIFAVNPEKNFSVPKDPLLYKIFKTSDLLIPDGIGIVLAAWVLYGLRLCRVPGVELMKNICRLSAQKKYKLFIYGGEEGVNKMAVEVLQKRHPGIVIAGRANGYVDDAKMDDLIDKINAAHTEILFLALGSPIQEKWFAQHKDRLETVRICQGIGGTLDTIAGKVKRAPKMWQACYTEWLYRLISEPKRIKRQKVLPLFALMLISAKLQSIGSFQRR